MSLWSPLISWYSLDTSGSHCLGESPWPGRPPPLLGRALSPSVHAYTLPRHPVPWSWPGPALWGASWDINLDVPSGPNTTAVPPDKFQ